MVEGSIVEPVPVPAGMVALVDGGGVTTGAGVEVTGAALEDEASLVLLEEEEVEEDGGEDEDGEEDSSEELESLPVGIAPPVILGTNVFVDEQGMNCR